MLFEDLFGSIGGLLSPVLSLFEGIVSIFTNLLGGIGL